MYKDGEMESFWAVDLKLPLKETFLVLLAGVGITALSIILSNLLFVATNETGMGKFLFPPSFVGRGFTIPVLDTIFQLIRDDDERLFGLIAQFVQTYTDVNKKFIIGMGIAPVLEEIQWRGFFYVARRHSNKKWWNICFLVSAGLFALWHPAGIGQVIGSFSVGLANWLILKKTQRL